MRNQAAWILAPKQNPLKVDSAPTWSPASDEVIIKVTFIALNPIDWKIQDHAPSFQTYPNILGRDVAGEIVEVGKNVTRVHKGQRVIAHLLGRATGDPRHGGFQLYAVAHEITVAPIPDSLPSEEAVVLPLAISTAAAGLYRKDFLALPFPTINPVKSGKIILVWGGSSSVGGTVIQLAVASGVDVAAVASKKNWNHVKSLGAKFVFDYSSVSVVDDIVAKLTESEFTGAYDAISSAESLKSTAAIVEKLGGGKMATVLAGVSGLPNSVTVMGVSAVSIATEEQDVGDAVWRKFVSAALASGQLLAQPKPLIIKGGLPKIQEGLDRLKKGVSAAKVVVEL